MKTVLGGHRSFTAQQLISAIRQSVRKVYLSDLIAGQIRNKLDDLLPVEIIATGIKHIDEDMASAIADSKVYTVIMGALPFKDSNEGNPHNLHSMSGYIQPTSQRSYVGIFSDTSRQGILIDLIPILQDSGFNSTFSNSDPFNQLLRLLCRDAITGSLGFHSAI